MKQQRKSRGVFIAALIVLTLGIAAAAYFLLQNPKMKKNTDAGGSSSALSEVSRPSSEESSEPEKKTEIDLKEMLVDYDLVKDRFGEVTGIDKDADMGVTIYTHGQLKAEYYHDLNEIISFQIDYSGDNPKDQYCVYGIDGTFTSERLFEEFGFPESDARAEGEEYRSAVYFTDAENPYRFIRVYFDEQNHIVRLDYANSEVA